MLLQPCPPVYYDGAQVSTHEVRVRKKPYNKIGVRPPIVRICTPEILTCLKQIDYTTSGFPIIVVILKHTIVVRDGEPDLGTVRSYRADAE